MLRISSSISAMSMIRKGYKITKKHGQWFDRGDAKIMAIYHPAALLRDPGKRPETFVDLKMLQRTIEDVCDHT